MSEIAQEQEFAPIQEEREEPESEKRAVISLFVIVILVVVIGILAWMSPFFIPYWDLLGPNWLWGYLPISMLSTVFIVWIARETITFRIRRKAKGEFLSIALGNVQEEEWSETFPIEWYVEVDLDVLAKQMTSEQKSQLADYSRAIGELKDTAAFRERERLKKRENRGTTETPATEIQPDIEGETWMSTVAEVVGKNRLRCPNCQAIYSYEPKELKGKKSIQCQNCGKKFKPKRGEEE